MLQLSGKTTEEIKNMEDRDRHTWAERREKRREKEMDGEIESLRLKDGKNSRRMSSVDSPKRLKKFIVTRFTRHSEICAFTCMSDSVVRGQEDELGFEPLF